MSSGSTLETVELLYDAALDGERWSMALAAVAAEVQSSFANLLWLDKRGLALPLSLLGGDYAPETAAPYARHYHRIDPRLALADAHPPGVVYACHHHLSDDDVGRSEIFQDLLIPYGIRYSAATRLIDNRESKAILGVMRAPEQGPFDDDSLARLGLLIPHLIRAAEIQRRLTQAEVDRTAVQVSLDRLEAAVILTDGDANVRYLNRAADRLMASAAGVRITQGRLTAVRAADDDRLRGAIKQAEGALSGGPGPQEQSFPIGRERKSPLLVAVTPLTPRACSSLGAARSAVAVFITDPEAHGPRSIRQFIQLFDLTRAEARLAQGLANGLSLDAIAKAHRVSKNTVRVQARAVYAKTGTSGQAELARLLALLQPAGS